MAPKTDLVTPKLSRRDFLRLSEYFGLSLAGLALGACAEQGASPRVEIGSNGEQNVGDWLKANGYAVESTTFVPNGKYGETRAFQVMQVESAETDQNYQLVREFFDPLLKDPEMEVIPVGTEDLDQDPEAVDILKSYFGEGKDGVVAAGVLLGSIEGLKRLVGSNELIGNMLYHMGDKGKTEISACKAGKEKGVGHRLALMVVILGAAAAALEAGRPGMLGVTMQAIAKGPGPSGAGESLHALFTIPMDQLDDFLLSVGQSRTTMLLTDLVKWKDAAGTENAVVRMMIEKAGPATAHFLTGGSEKLYRVLEEMRLGKSQFGKLLSPEHTGEYLGVLTGLRLLYQKALKRMGGSYQELCNQVGKLGEQLTPTPKPKIEELADYNEIWGFGVNEAGEQVWLNDLGGRPSADNSYFMVMPGLKWPGVILTLP